MMQKSIIMNRIKQFLLFIVFISGLFSCQEKDSYDVVIYGGTSAGISAAVQTARMGHSVVIINPDEHIGGLTTGGLGQTDIGNKNVIGGISREFYQRIKKYYDDPDHWKWEDKSDYRDGGQTRTLAGEDAMWTFEPGAAMAVFRDFISEYKIPVICNERLDLKNGVEKQNNKIISIKTESGKEFKGKMFIDATYEGDLMATAGISYTFGREAVLKYGETLNGVQTKRAKSHQFKDGIDPYIEAGNPASGLLPNINKQPGAEGSGDKKIQAYCFRMCLTDVPENRIPFRKPANYNDLEYELLFRLIEKENTSHFFIISMMPNRKTDANNFGGFSSDYIGKNYGYPDGDYAQREKIIKEHKDYQLGLLWTLANHPRVPENIREVWQKWGLPKDEFVESGNWTPQLYVREARRMVSNFIMTQHHCMQDSVSAEFSIGMGAYTMDSHHVQRYVTQEGFVKNEGDIQVGGFTPYPIDYRSIIPKKEECTNLLVPVCLSATHIAFGSIRMEPVFMVLGQSAATAACISIEKNVDIQHVNYEELQEKLLDDKQILSYNK
jgi:hypothetical protein